MELNRLRTYRVKIISFGKSSGSKTVDDETVRGGFSGIFVSVRTGLAMWHTGEMFDGAVGLNNITKFLCKNV